MLIVSLSEPVWHARGKKYTRHTVCRQDSSLWHKQAAQTLSKQNFTSGSAPFYTASEADSAFGWDALESWQYAMRYEL